MDSISDLLANFPYAGSVVWIGRRPARRADVVPCECVIAQAGGGLDGDHYSGRSGSRGVTLIQAEHLAVIGALLRRRSIDPALVRRNIVVSGVNLIALKGLRFRLGAALLEGTGPCPPCSRMEEVLGPGAYNAMRGHAGLSARVISGGAIRVGDTLMPPTPAAGIESASQGELF